VDTPEMAAVEIAELTNCLRDISFLLAIDFSFS
jgi:hypothetical protein